MNQKKTPGNLCGSPEFSAVKKIPDLTIRNPELHSSCIMYGIPGFAERACGTGVESIPAFIRRDSGHAAAGFQNLMTMPYARSTLPERMHLVQT